MRIFLIGFMGSGKTHWGKLLTQKTGAPFFDLDKVIVDDEGKSIAQIFLEKGEEYFRYKEKEVMEQIVEEHENIILSCGGGTPCFFNNIDFMKDNGTVIWLNTCIDTLVQRLLKEKSHRPLIKSIDDKDLKAFILKKLQDRRLYYEQANIIVAEESLTIDDLSDLIQDRKTKQP
jgi:shikimate kinase